VFGAIGYVANWRFVADGRAYSELFSAPSPLQHFWSLAIEEQFYLLFPLLVFAVLRVGRGRRMLLGGVLAAGIVGSIAASHAFAGDQLRAYYGTDTRASELLVGALLAVVCLRWSGPRTERGRTVLGYASLAAVLVVLFLWVTADQHDRWLFEGGLAVHAALIGLVIIAARADTVVARGLGNRVLVGLGLISYGVYLYHWPLFLWLSPERTGLFGPALFALRSGATLAIAIASYFLIEQPVRSGRQLRGAWPRVVAPVAISGLVVLAIAVTASPPPPPFVLEPVAATPPASAPAAIAPLPVVAPDTSLVARAAPTSTAPAAFHRVLEAARPVRVLVVGDSVGVTLGRGIELWGNETGRVTVRNEGRLWCSLGRYVPRADGYRDPVDQGEGCNDWESRWTSAIKRFDPDAVVVMFSIWETVGRLPPGASDLVGPGNPLHDEWQLAEYHRAANVLTQRGAVVTWMTIPCSDKDHSGPGSPLWFVNHNTIGRLDRARDEVQILDLDRETCPRHAYASSYAGIDPARPDGRHYSDEGALAVARWALPIMLGDVAAPEPPTTLHAPPD
jgi:peptidoglycan/LPS O-acetylase OafA/YrhL